MCGIAGFWDTSGKTPQDLLHATVDKMRDTLLHRGPDGADSWVDAANGVAFGHRRLAILDLSEHGNQPMHSTSNRYTIIFNGEIYNHLEIKQQLTNANLAPTWRGHSDTEIILAAFEAYGVEQALQYFVGMFAIALWDRQDKLLYLIRDRIGEKPLYYGWVQDHLLFGSELKSFKAHFAWKPEINPDAVALYTQFNCIPAPYTIYTNTFKVEPGHLLVIKPNKQVHDIAYWQLKNVINTNALAQLTPLQAIDQLEAKLQASIQQQMLADVPVGAFLSGGIDSSTIVALMQVNSSRPVKTFTIGFEEPNYNEAEHANLIAKHLQTQHTELYLSGLDTQAIIPGLANLYDEPFADSSQLPTYIVAKLTREHVTVSLSGDGGDELFGGYNRYMWTSQLWRKLALFPKPIRIFLSKLISKIAPRHWDKLFASINCFMPRNLQQRNFGDKLHKIAELCSSVSLNDVYYKLTSTWQQPQHKNILPDLSTDLLTQSFTETMMYIDTMRYLPDDILVKVDRAGMAVSLETRMPFLDHRVVEYAWSLPQDMKLHDGQNKWILRQVLNRYVPPQLYDRPKMGFGVPIDQWMRGPLKEWAQDLMTSSMLNKHNSLDQNIVRSRWQEHMSGAGNWQHHLWCILMFQSWYEANHG